MQKEVFNEMWILQGGGYLTEKKLDTLFNWFLVVGLLIIYGSGFVFLDKVKNNWQMSLFGILMIAGFLAYGFTLKKVYIYLYKKYCIVK